MRSPFTREVLRRTLKCRVTTNLGAAKVYGVDYVGSSYVLVRAMRERLVSKVDAKQAVNDMVSAGWRCSVESYSKIMDVLEKLPGSEL